MSQLRIPYGSFTGLHIAFWIPVAIYINTTGAQYPEFMLVVIQQICAYFTILVYYHAKDKAVSMTLCLGMAIMYIWTLCMVSMIIYGHGEYYVNTICRTALHANPSNITYDKALKLHRCPSQEHWPSSSYTYMIDYLCLSMASFIMLCVFIHDIHVFDKQVEQAQQPPSKSST